MSTPSVGTLRGTQMGSANFEFKSKYLRTLEYALLIALAIHLIVIFSVPPIEIQPYKLKEKKMQAIDIPNEIVIPPPPKEIERPALPTELEVSEDVSMEETIPETDFNPFAPPEIKEDTGSGEAFYAFDTPPTPIKTVAPEYPDLARQAGAEGTVLIEVTINENGRVIAARVIKSTTISSLAEAARKAAMDWLFTPAKQRDVPVKAKIAIPFEFHLHS
jgi:protein TonB